MASGTAVLTGALVAGLGRLPFTAASLVLGVSLALVHAAPLATAGRANAKRMFASELPLVAILLLPFPEAVTTAVVVAVAGRIAARLLSPDERVRRTSLQLHLFNAASDALLVLSGAALVLALDPVVPRLGAAVVAVIVAWWINHLLIAVGVRITTGRPFSEVVRDGLRDGLAALLLWTVAGTLVVQPSDPTVVLVLCLSGSIALMVAAHLSTPAMVERSRTDELARMTLSLVDSDSEEKARRLLVDAAEELLAVGRAEVRSDPPPASTRLAAARMSGTDDWLVVRDRVRAFGDFTSSDHDVLRALAASAGTTIARLRATERERTADQARQGLLETISHDLRGPLTTAALAVATLKHERVAEVDQTRTMEILERSLAAAAGIVDDVVALHRDADGPSGVCEVDAVLMDAVPPLADLLGRSVTLTLAAGRAEAALPAEALRRIVENLVRNAHVHGRGETVEVHSEVRGDTVRVLVRDRGPGVPAAVRERLGRTGNRAAGTGADGLGLGLRIALHLVRRHGGDLAVHDRDGGGAEIAVTLPQHLE